MLITSDVLRFSFISHNSSFLRNYFQNKLEVIEYIAVPQYPKENMLAGARLSALAYRQLRRSLLLFQESVHSLESSARPAIVC